MIKLRLHATIRHLLFVFFFFFQPHPFSRPKFNKSALDMPSGLNASQFPSVLEKQPETPHLAANREHKQCIRDASFSKGQRQVAPMCLLLVLSLGLQKTNVSWNGQHSTERRVSLCFLVKWEHRGSPRRKINSDVLLASVGSTFS